MRSPVNQNQRMDAFLVKHGYCGRKPAAHLLEPCARSRPPPSARCSPRRCATRSLPWRTVLRALNGAIKDLDRSVTAHLGKHPDGEIFTSLPRSGRINAVQMLAGLVGG